MTNITLLIEQAWYNREIAYAPYSDFTVGASVLGDNGIVYHGSNIEVACSSAGICAERIAIANCVMAGAKPKHLVIIADTKEPITPCGTCRQFMSEFTPLKVTMANINGDIKTTTANKLLPLKFERRTKK
jgi:cytidine deaminase